MLLGNITDRLAKRKIYVFCLFWLTTFIIYLPAAHCGFVADATSNFKSLIDDSFADFINRRRSGGKSMYQLTQLITWAIYQAAGFSHWGWHLVFITAHSICCLLLFTCCRSLFERSGIVHPARPALAGALLCCISPYASEVVVWESSLPYMQAFAFLMAILILQQRFQERFSAGPAIGAGLIFLAATFTHELWYLTPLFTLALALYHRLALNGARKVFLRTLLCFTIPQLLCFGLHRWLFRLIYGSGIPRVGDSFLSLPPGYFLVKAPWYFFHLFAWGRFFPDPIRQAVYNLFRTPLGALCFYGLLAGICLYILARFRRMQAFGKALSLLFVFYLIAQSILAVLYFPETGLVICDRYAYYLLAFQWMMVALIVLRIRKAAFRYGLILLPAAINLYFTLSLSLKWQASDALITHLQTSPVFKPGKVKLLLNSPTHLNGISMIGLSPEGEFRLMHNLFFRPQIPDTLLEVAAYDMRTVYDGARAQMLNDSMVRVTLNQPGNWGWQGAYHPEAYRHAYFRIDTVDPAHFYIITLQAPYDRYQLLYQQGGLLKEVNAQLRTEQD